MNRFGTLVFASLATATLVAGCASSHVDAAAAASTATVAQAMPLAARSVMNPTEGNSVTGTVSFTQVEGGVRVVAVFAGLTAGDHGFHVHEQGDCSAPDGTSAGGHFNPEGHPHGLPGDPNRHAGDLGNLVADETGHATLDHVFAHLTLDGADGIVGRGLIVHAAKDDGGQPTGNAGGRVACGVITADK